MKIVIGLLTLAVVTALVITAISGLLLLLARAATRTASRQVAAVGTGVTAGLAAETQSRTCPRPGCTEANPLDALHCSRCGVTLREAD